MERNRELLSQNDPELYEALVGEENRQRRGIELIPSENYTFPEVLAALGSVFTNKYSEGYPGRRYYGGQEFTDAIEKLARERAKRVFRCEHANVQPLSGSPMNQAVYLAFMKPGDTILGMDLSHGGHLTHGAPVSHMGKIFNFVRYKTHPEEQGRIDFDELRRVALETRPKMVLCGYTSYPRDYDYGDFKRIADEVDAITMADVSHIGGLIAAGVMRNPFDYDFDIVTTTTHKSLRGPRGGMMLCKKKFAREIDKSVFPGLQGGPHMNTIAGIAITLGKALQPEFREYGAQVLRNAKTLADDPDGERRLPGDRRDRQPHDGARHRGEPRDRRQGGRGDTGPDRHHHQQADHSRRSQSAPAPERHSHRHARGHVEGDEGRGYGEARRVDRRALAEREDEGALSALCTEVEAFCRDFPVPGISS